MVGHPCMLNFYIYIYFTKYSVIIHVLKPCVPKDFPVICFHSDVGSMFSLDPPTVFISPGYRGGWSHFWFSVGIFHLFILLFLRGP